MDATATTQRNPLFLGLMVGFFGGCVLALMAMNTCALALVDTMANDDAMSVTHVVVILLVGTPFFVYSLRVAIRSERVARVWRKLFLCASFIAFATPVAAGIALIRLAIKYEHMSMGPILYLFAGISGIIGGIILRVIGLHIARTPRHPVEPVETKKL